MRRRTSTSFTPRAFATQKRRMTWLVLSFDGKGVAMRHDDLREATRKAAEATPRTLHSRLAKGEKPNRKRMAQVAAIYSLPRWRRTIADVLHGLHDPKERDAKRPRPINKRVWASIEHGVQQVVDDAFCGGPASRSERKRRRVVLVDGQPDQIKRVQRAARKAGVEITIQLDIAHVLEYLWRAAYVFHPESSPEAEKWVEDRLLALLSGRPAGEIAKSLRAMIVRHDLNAKIAKPVVKCASYLVKNARWLHYDRALADGLPFDTRRRSRGRARAGAACDARPGPRLRHRYDGTSHSRGTRSRSRSAALRSWSADSRPPGDGAAKQRLSLPAARPRGRRPPWTAARTGAVDAG